MEAPKRLRSTSESNTRNTATTSSNAGRVTTGSSPTSPRAATTTTTTTTTTTSIGGKTVATADRATDQIPKNIKEIITEASNKTGSEKVQNRTQSFDAFCNRTLLVQGHEIEQKDIRELRYSLENTSALSDEEIDSAIRLAYALDSTPKTEITGTVVTRGIPNKDKAEVERQEMEKSTGYTLSNKILEFNRVIINGNKGDEYENTIERHFNFLIAKLGDNNPAVRMHALHALDTLRVCNRLNPEQRAKVENAVEARGKVEKDKQVQKNIHQLIINLQSGSNYRRSSNASGTENRPLSKITTIEEQQALANYEKLKLEANTLTRDLELATRENEALIKRLEDERRKNNKALLESSTLHQLLDEQTEARQQKINELEQKLKDERRKNHKTFLKSKTLRLTLEEQASTRQRRINELEQELEDERRKNNKALQESRTLQQILDEQASARQQKIYELERALQINEARLKEQHELVDIQTEQLKEERQKAEASLGEFKASKHALNKQVEVLINRINELERALQINGAELKDQRNLFDIQREKLDKARDKDQEHASLVNKLANAVRLRNELLKKQKTQLVELNAELEKIKAQPAISIAEHEALKAENEKIKQELTEKLKDSERIINKSRIIVQQKVQEVLELELIVENLRQKAMTSEVNNKLKTELSEKQEMLEIAYKEISRLQENAQNEKEAFENEIQNLNIELNYTKLQLHNAQSKPIVEAIGVYEAKIYDQITQIRSLQEELNQAISKIRNFQDKVKTLSFQNENDQAIIETLTQDNLTFRDLYKEQVKEVNRLNGILAQLSQAQGMVV